MNPFMYAGVKNDGRPEASEKGEEVGKWMEGGQQLGKDGGKVEDRVCKRVGRAGGEEKRDD